MIPLFDKPLPRRTFLRGAGGAVLGLPFLEAMLPRRASAATAARRFIAFYFSNGVNSNAWKGTDSGTLTLPSILAPLEPLKHKLVLLNGVGMETARANPGNGHNVGMTNLLTARKFTDGQGTQFGTLGWGAGISLDQELAAKVGKGTRFPSLQFGVQSMKYYMSPTYSYLSYTGPKRPVQAEDNPRVMFDRVFKDLSAPGQMVPGAADDRRARKRRILDLVKDDIDGLLPRLGKADRDRLGAHLEAVHQIQTGLDLGTGQSAAGCRKPSVDSAMNHNDSNLFPAVGKVQAQLLTMALTCDLTRVATMQWSCAQSGTVHRWNSVTEHHHGLSHKTDGTSQSRLTGIQRWYMQQVFDLAKGLDAVMDVNGKTLLDNTVILVCSEVGVGHTHTFLDMPFLLVGGCGGAIKTGRLLRYDRASHNDLYVSLLNAMGVDTRTFGDAAFCKGPLSGLVG